MESIKKTKKGFRKWLRALVVVTVFLSACLFITTSFFILKTSDSGHYPRTVDVSTTTPVELPKTVIEDLCSRSWFLKLCDSEENLYTGDVEAIFKSTLQSGLTTHADITDFIGKYELSCSDPFGDYYTCSYDLSVSAPMIEITYTPANIVKSIYFFEKY